MKQFYISNLYNLKLNIIEGDDIDNIKGILIHLHGLGSHFQKVYKGLDEFDERDKIFRGFGLKSFALEYTGHGKSEGDKCLITNFDLLLDDLSCLLDCIKKRYDFPIFIFAESMGCAVALKYCITRENNISGLICLAPLFGIDKHLIPNIFIRKCLSGLSYIYPKFLLKTNSNKLAKECSDNLEFIHAKKNNDYTFNGIHCLATCKELVLTSEWISENGYKFNKPIIIFHGLEDSITVPSISKEIYERMISNDKTLHLIDDGYHCLLISSQKRAHIPPFIISKVLEWLNNKIN